MSDVKIIRLITGEDVISKTKEDSGEGIELHKPFVIIPTQQAPGKPVQLMMTHYSPYSKSDTIKIKRDKVVSIVEPKDEILKSYQANTSSIIQTDKSLITENKLPKLS
jgi:hypothetical protein